MLTGSMLLPNQAVIPLGTAVIFIALCIYVLLQRRFNDSIDRLFVVYLLIAALWSIILAAGASNTPLLPGFTWFRLASYGLLILGIIYWVFARVFLQLPWLAWDGWALGGIGLGFLVSLDAPWLVVPPAALTWARGWAFADNQAFVFSTLWWGLFMAMAVVTAGTQYFQTASPAHRNRIQYLLISTLLLSLGLGMYLGLREPFWTAGLLFSICGGVLITYTVVTEDLIDLGVGVRRVISDIFVALVTVIVYVGSLDLIQILLGDSLRLTFRFMDRALVMAALAVVLLTVVYMPIRQLSQNLINRVLFGQRYDYQGVIHNYSQAVSNRLYLGELATVALNHISSNMGIDRGALFIIEADTPETVSLRSLPLASSNNLPRSISLSKGTPITNRLITEGQPLAQYTIDLSSQFKTVPEAERRVFKDLQFEWYIPVIKKEQLIGLFTLGPKRSGRPYNAEDIRLLKTLADQTGLALENAALFDRVQRNLEEISRMKNLMDNVFDSIDNGVITTDIDGRITFFNRAAEAILALSPESCVGVPYTEALPSFADTVLFKLMQNVTSRESHYANYELTSDLPGRGRVNLSLNLAPLKDAQDQTQGVAMVVDDLTETKRLRAVKDIFRRYVSPVVVDRLPANPEDLQLGGVRQVVTIIFADLRGFTTFSEKLPPEVLVEKLNQYLSMAASAILMYEGTLDKFMGDAVMGIFNAPLEQADHPLRAVRAAAAIQQAVADFHRNTGQKRALNFSIGLHMGEVVMGNVGLSDRMDYTAIGDAVNLAKRIQENTPGGKVMMSEAVYTIVKDSVRANFNREMHVKGREEPVRTYELCLP